MALVGNISGSIQNNSNIGVSGSVVIANRPDALFPTLGSVGGDVVFFVSGSRGGKGSTAERTVSVFGGDAVVSGSLTIGTGSITITSNDITFQGGIAQIFSGSGGLTFADSSGTKTLSELAASTGDVAGPASSTDNAIARFDLTTGKLLQNSAITISDASGGGVTMDTGVSETTVNLFTTNATSVVIGKAGGSTVTTSGNIKVGSNTIQAADGATALTLTSASGDVTVAGDLTVTGNDIKASDGNTNITLTGNTLTTVAGDLKVGGNDIQASDGNINITLASNTLTTFAGDIKVTGNDIQASDGNVNITMTSNTLTEVKGDLQVTGNDIKGSSGTTNISLNYSATPGDVQVAGNLWSGQGIIVGSNQIKASNQSLCITLDGTDGSIAVNGDLTVSGNDIKSNGGTTAITLSGDNVTIPGNLTVNGTTTTVNTTNLIVEDPLIYMASSSAPGTVGYGGIAIASGSGVTNQALVFVKDTNGTEAVWSSGRQDVNAGSETTNTGLTYLPIRASKFEVGGTLGAAGRSFISSSDGSVLSAVAGGDLFLNAAAGPPGSNGNVVFEVAGTDYLQVSGSAGNKVEFKAPALIVSASILETTVEDVRAFSAATFIRLGATSGATTTIRGGTLNGNQTTQNIFNTTATTVNFAGAATTLNVGGATGNSTANIAVSDPGVGNTKTINIGTSGGANSTTNINLGSSAGGTITANRSLIPSVDVTYNLGGANNRWANIYTGDLHLKNDRGDYTLIEEEDFLSIRFNKTGKRYKFVLEPVPELDEK